jgi:hypothetical protein
MNISEFQKKLFPEPAWRDGAMLPYQQPEVPVHYVLDEDRGGGKFKLRDSDQSVPRELYNPPGDGTPGWWNGRHELRLTNNRNIDIIWIGEPSENGIYRFTSSPVLVKEGSGDRLTASRYEETMEIGDYPT